MQSSTNYDEDINENAFFIQLQSRFLELFERATVARSTLCVPRISSFNRKEFSIEDYKDHFLKKLNDDEGCATFKTLSDKTVEVINGVIHIRSTNGFAEERRVTVLFEETFFNSNDESYPVLCVSGPLSGESAAVQTSDVETPHTTFHYLSDCEHLLWRKAGNQRLGDSLSHLQQSFAAEIRTKRDYDLKACIDTGRTFFRRGVLILLKDKQIKRKFYSEPPFQLSALLALESFLLFKVYSSLYAHLCTCLAKRDASLNKLCRNLRSLQLRDLSVRPECCQNVPRSRKEIASITRFTTPMGKLNCLHHVFQTLQRTNGSKNSVPLTSDDLLPIAVFLIVKTENPHWVATLTFMTDFRFSQQPISISKTRNDVALGTNSDEFSFCLATFEAAIEHITRKQVFTSSYDRAAKTSSQVVSTELDSSPDSGKIFFAEQKSKTSEFFDLVRKNNLEGLKELVEKYPTSPTKEDARSRNKGTAAEFELCHPLCSCDRCKSTADQLEEDRERQTLDLYSLDDLGLSALHIAAANASTDVIDFLLAQGMDVNTTDVQGQTALHVACAVGKQKPVLYLLHQKARVNEQDNQGNTALHHAALNGHADCVQALLYFDGGVSRIDANIANEFGDRPLHFASKWGYLKICNILLENGAITNCTNRKNVTPIDLAHNLIIRDVLINPKYTQAEDASSLSSYATASEASFAKGIRSSVSGSSLSSAASPHRSASFLSRESISDALQTTSSESPSSGAEATKPGGRVKSKKEAEVEKLLRAVQDNDLPLVRFLLGWPSEAFDSSSDERTVSPDAKQLCHPLCQCNKCQPLQAAISPVPTRKAHAIQVNSQNASGVTALHKAVQLGSVDFAKLFIRKGAHVNAATKTGETPLHVALKNKQDSSVELLLKHSADTNMRDARGNTPLHVAALSDNEKMIKRLVECQASVNAQNSRGNTPLHEAARASHIAATRVLVTYGCDVTVANKHGQLPVDASRREEIQFFLRHAQALRKKTLSS